MQVLSASQSCGAERVKVHTANDSFRSLYRRRDLIALASLFLGAAGSAPLVSDPGLVDPYDEAREARLYGREQPFIALYRRAPYVLGVVASVHSVDPSSKTFASIDRAFDLVRPAIVILEGFPTTWGKNPERILAHIPHRNDPGASSYARGECVHAASLAVDRGVEFCGGELTDRELIGSLVQQGYDAQDIFYAAMFGPLAQDARAGDFTGPTDLRFAPAFDKWARNLRPDYPASVDTSFTGFQAWFARIYGRPLDSDPDWADHGGPGEPEIAGQIGKASNLLRDQYVVGLMIRLLNERQRVLTVFGGSHLSSQWRALKAALGSPRLIGHG